jgi:hypothetical protein
VRWKYNRNHMPSRAGPISQLSHKVSAQRRSAAKQLRKLKDKNAGPALAEALAREVQDRRTWETQYQMIMALGESDYRPALPLLEQLRALDLEPMVRVALGDAWVRLARTPDGGAAPVLDILKEGDIHLAEGALRAVAMLRLALTSEAVERILDYASRPENAKVRFWVAAAAPGWSGPVVDSFLRSCTHDTLADTRRAAEAALRREYLRWNPL